MSHVLAAAPSGTNTDSIAVETIFWILAVLSVGAALAMLLAQLIFTTYVFPFEVTGALLITAAVGAMVLAHRERTTPKPTQRDLAAKRLASGQLAPDPAPGVYALHDAADRPALLPDGSTSELSVSQTLAPRDPNEETPPVRPELAAPPATEASPSIPGRAES